MSAEVRRNLTGRNGIGNIMTSLNKANNNVSRRSVIYSDFTSRHFALITHIPFLRKSHSQMSNRDFKLFRQQETLVIDEPGSPV
jgi:hypothetical protein